MQLNHWIPNTPQKNNSVISVLGETAGSGQGGRKGVKKRGGVVNDDHQLEKMYAWKAVGRGRKE